MSQSQNFLPATLAAPPVKLFFGNALTGLAKLPDASLDAVIIDPPYGENMGFDGDHGLRDAEDLITAFCNAVYPKMKPNAYLAVFWTSHALDVLIDAVRSTGYCYRRTLHMYLPKGGARPFLGWLPRTQEILLAQKWHHRSPSLFHQELCPYLADAIKASGETRQTLAQKLGCNSRLVMKWTREDDPAWCLPTPRFWKPLKEMLSLDNRYDFLLDRVVSHGPDRRTDYEYKHDTYIPDAKAEKFEHPCQKPLSVIEHLVKTLTLPGETVLDGFTGSGTTAVACLRTGRGFIGYEKDPAFFEIAIARIIASNRPVADLVREDHSIG